MGSPATDKGALSLLRIAHQPTPRAYRPALPPESVSLVSSVDKFTMTAPR